MFLILQLSTYAEEVDNNEDESEGDEIVAKRGVAMGVAGGGAGGAPSGTGAAANGVTVAAAGVPGGVKGSVVESGGHESSKVLMAVLVGDKRDELFVNASASDTSKFNADTVSLKEVLRAMDNRKGDPVCLKIGICQDPKSQLVQGGRQIDWRCGITCLGHSYKVGKDLQYFKAVVVGFFVPPNAPKKGTVVLDYAPFHAKEPSYWKIPIWGNKGLASLDYQVLDDDDVCGSNLYAAASSMS